MLQPSNRLTLIDSMRPPAGMRIESAMAVTFTLDLRALLAAPAAFALTGPESLSSDGSQHEPIELLHAVRSHADKITVFSQVGEIALPPSRKVFAFFERSVIPVSAPLHGIVHPKVWVLRYEPIDETPGGEPIPRLRVLIASRNLTFDSSWDTVVRLDEAANGKGVSLEPVGYLFEGLLNEAAAPAVEHRDRVRSLASSLRGATFSRPAGVDDLQVHVLGLTETASPLPATAKRSLIISPFLSDDFFTRVRPAPVDELVSRPESLDGLTSEALDRVRSTYAFDDGSVPDLDAKLERRSTEDPGRPIVGLHAKVFAFEVGDRAHLFLGSANATGPAFNNSVEILVELVGTIADLGIERLCNGTEEEPGLRLLFTTYRRSSLEESESEETSLDGLRRCIAGLSIEGIVEESDTGWAVVYRSDEPIPGLEGAEIHCWPLASAGNRRQVEPGAPLDVRFETTLETISGFLAFEIAHESGGLTEFVAPVPLSGVPEDRDRLLLRALVGNAERFLRYLMALLDEDPGQMELLDAVERVHAEGNPEEGSGTVSLPVLEKLLRTMRRDPSKLAGLHPLVQDLAADDALTPGFADLWSAIYDVANEGASGQ